MLQLSLEYNLYVFVDVYIEERLIWQFWIRFIKRHSQFRWTNVISIIVHFVDPWGYMLQ
jgi:hypothetical protein